MSNWICFFSQTGSEIYNVSQKIHRSPDLIVTNKQNLKDANINLVSKYEDRIVFIPQKPTLKDYQELIEKYSVFNDCIITLHGYLRIIPAVLCNTYNIYNLHPGLITKYPELKGFNPQEKAFNMNLSSSGAVIHKVVEAVDSGEVLASVEVDIKNLTQDEVYSALHEVSSELWVDFLCKYNIINN